jgi:hypothetical protein
MCSDVVTDTDANANANASANDAKQHRMSNLSDKCTEFYMAATVV